MSCLVATPCYGGQATLAYVQSILELAELGVRAGFSHEWQFTDKESLIPRGRNTMVSAFLTQVDLKVYERILFIDADIDFSADDVAKLWNLDLPVAVAAYSMKRMDNPLSAWRNGKLVEITDDMKEPFEVDYAGTGFMMIKREVLERMIDWSHAEYEKIRARLKSAGIDPQELGDWLRLPVTHEEAHVGTCYAIFDCGVVDDGAGAFYSSEDYWFCRKIRQMGEKIVMDPTIRLGHWGTFRYGAR